MLNMTWGAAKRVCCQQQPLQVEATAAFVKARLLQIRKFNLQ
jgi:hypothetical protein